MPKLSEEMEEAAITMAGDTTMAMITHNLNTAHNHNTAHNNTMHHLVTPTVHPRPPLNMVHLKLQLPLLLLTNMVLPKPL